MRRDGLRDLAGNPNFVSRIYNYCDRWCERCRFTSRCFLHATEQADPDLDDPEVRDITSVDKSFRDALVTEENLHRDMPKHSLAEDRKVTIQDAVAGIRR